MNFWFKESSMPMNKLLEINLAVATESPPSDRRSHRLIHQLPNALSAEFRREMSRG